MCVMPRIYYRYRHYHSKGLGSTQHHWKFVLLFQDYKKESHLLFTSTSLHQLLYRQRHWPGPSLILFDIHSLQTCCVSQLSEWIRTQHEVLSVSASSGRQVKHIPLSTWVGSSLLPPRSGSMNQDMPRPSNWPLTSSRTTSAMSAWRSVLLASLSTSWPPWERVLSTVFSRASRRPQIYLKISESIPMEWQCL